MRTRILKKEPSSRVLTLPIMLFSLVVMAQNSFSSHATERDHLLINEEGKHKDSHRESKAPLSLVLSLQEEISDGGVSFNNAHFDLIEEVLIDPNSSLLNKPDATKVQAQMNYVADFISLHHNGKKSFNRLQAKYFHEASEVGVSIESLDKLQKYLEDKSWDAISKAPTLQGYLKERRLQSEDLIELFEKVIAERTLLREQNNSLQLKNKALAKLCEGSSKQERSKPEKEVNVVVGNELEDAYETIKILQRNKSLLQYVGAPITFLLGIVCGGVGTGLFMHYYFMGR